MLFHSQTRLLATGSRVVMQFVSTDPPLDGVASPILQHRHAMTRGPIFTIVLVRYWFRVSSVEG